MTYSQLIDIGCIDHIMGFLLQIQASLLDLTKDLDILIDFKI